MCEEQAQDGHLHRQYVRPAKGICPSPHAVAFLDILGFKNLLRSKQFALIGVLFEEICDALYMSRRMNYLLGFHVLEPQIANFSDSIILYSKFHSGATNDNDVKMLNDLTFQLLVDVCRRIVAVGLRLRIPIRGAMSIGEFYAGEAESIQPESVTRGEPVVMSCLLKVADVHELAPADYQTRVMPRVRFPIHLGDALTDAYLLESSINSIGVFMNQEFQDHPHTTVSIRTNKMASITLDGSQILTVNWFETGESLFGPEETVEILKYAENQAVIKSGRIAEKWRSLVNYTRHAFGPAIDKG